MQKWMGNWGSGKGDSEFIWFFQTKIRHLYPFGPTYDKKEQKTFENNRHKCSRKVRAFDIMKIWLMIFFLKNRRTFFSFWKAESIGLNGKWCSFDGQREIMLFQPNHRKIYKSWGWVGDFWVHAKSWEKINRSITGINELYNFSGLDVSLWNVRNSCLLPSSGELRGGKFRFGLSSGFDGWSPDAIFWNFEKFLRRIWPHKTILFTLVNG